MTNPVAQIRKTFQSVKHEDGTYGPETEDLWTDVEVYCPGCDARHRFTIEVHQADYRRPDGSPHPTWDWNGSLESPTFSPSLLCYFTVHRCEGQHTYTECPTAAQYGFDRCEHRSHGHAWRMPDGTERTYKNHEPVPEGVVEFMYGEVSPHPLDPPFGNCHTFLKDGVWEFLGDCAHDLRGFVPLEPLPDWLVKD